MNRGQLRNLFFACIGEGAPPYLGSADDLLNAAKDHLAVEAEHSWSKFALTGGLILNQHDYTFSGRLIRVSTLLANNASTKLAPLPAPLSWQEMFERFPTWLDTGETAGLPDTWTYTADAVWVKPKPSATYVGTPLVMFGPQIPPDMTADSGTGSEPTDLPDPFHRLIAYYAAAEWFSVDKDSPAAAKGAAYWMARYERGLRRLRAFIGGRIGVDPRGARVDVGRPSSVASILDDVPGEPD